MATIQDLFTALRNADAAGNTEDAKRLAEIIHGLGFGERQQVAEEAPKKEPGVGAYLKDIPKALGRGVVGLGETAGIGVAGLLPEEYETKARKGISSLAGTAQDYLAPETPEIGESISSKLAAGVGSTLPFFAAAPFGVAGAIGATGLGVAAGAGEARQAAEAKGATGEERRTATLLGAPVGFLDIIAPEIKPFKGLLTTAAVRGGIEGLTEAAQKVAQNLIAKGVYDPKQEIMVGAGEEGAYGAGVGALASLIVDMTVGRRARTPEAKEQPPEVPQREVAAPVAQPALPTGGGFTADQAAALRQEAIDAEAARVADIEQANLQQQQYAQSLAAGMPGFAGPAGANQDFIAAARADRAAEQKRLADEQLLADQQRQQQIQQASEATYSADPFQNEIMRSRALADLGVTPQQQIQEVTKPSEDDLIQEMPSGEPTKKFSKFVPPKNIPVTEEEAATQKAMKTRLEELNAEIKEASKSKSDLFKALEGKMKPEEVRAIFPEAGKNYPAKSEMGKQVAKYRKLINTQGRGQDLSSLVSDGALDDYLPPKLRVNAMQESGAVADEHAGLSHIIDNMTSGNTQSHDESEKLRALNEERDNLQSQLQEPAKQRDLNYQLQQAADERVAERTGLPAIGLPELIADAQSRGIDTEAIQERVAMQMPQATQAQYLGALHNQISNELARLEGRVAGQPITETLQQQKSGTGNVSTSEGKSIQKQLEGKDFDQAVQWMIKNAPNRFQQMTAERVRDMVNALKREGVVFNFDLQGGNQRNTRLYNAEGVTTFLWGREGTSITVQLNGEPVFDNQLGYPSGMNYGTIQHEMLHVATRTATRFLPVDHPVIADLRKLFNDVVYQYNKDAKAGKLPEVLQKYYKRMNNVLASPDELITWGLTDRDFQEYLANINVGPKQTAYSKFVQLIRELLGIAKPFQTALEKLVQTTEAILDIDTQQLKGEMIKQDVTFGTPRAPSIKGEQQSLFSKRVQKLLRDDLMVRKNGFFFDAKESPLYQTRTADEARVVSQQDFDAAVRGTKTGQRIMDKNVQIKDGDYVGVRLDLNILRSTGVPVQSIHQGKEATHEKGAGFYNGEVIKYAPWVTLKNVRFKIQQGAREKIASGQETKSPMGSADGQYVKTDKPNFDGIELRFNPNREHLFRDALGRAVKYADEITTTRNGVFARGNIEYYGEEDLPPQAISPSESRLMKEGEQIAVQAAQQTGSVSQPIQDSLFMQNGLSQQDLFADEEDVALANFLKSSKEKRRLYHGTNKGEIRSFIEHPEKLVPSGYMWGQKGNETYKMPIFLSPSPFFANHFAKAGTKSSQNDSGQYAVYPVYAKVENPFDYENPNHIEKLEKFFQKQYDDWHKENPSAARAPNVNLKYLAKKTSTNFNEIESPEILYAIQKLGFDSVYVLEGNTKNIGVFDPKRIKSSFGKPSLYNIEENLLKHSEQQPNQLGNDAMAILQSVGWDVAEPEAGKLEKLKQLKKDYVQNPQATREAAYGSLRRFADQVETWAFSSDAGLNNQIHREIMNSMVGKEEAIGMLLNTSLSQTAHSDAVASLFLREGNIRYNSELHKWEGVKDDNNFINLSKTIDKISDRSGLTKEQAELVAHKAFEARRVVGWIQYNNDLMTQAEGLRYEASLERAKGNAVKASALSEKASNVLKKSKHIHLSDEQIRAGMKQFDLFPELQEVTKYWDGIRKNALQVMVDTGLYSQEEAEMLLDVAEYVPFYREEQLEGGGGPKEFLRSLSVQADKAAKGSEKPVNDIFDNMVRWTQYAINRGVRNRSGIALAKTAVEMNLARRVVNEVNEQTAKEVGEKDLNKLVAKQDATNVVRVWENGQQVEYSMDDPMFVSAFRGLESVSIPTVKFFSKFADVLRQSVVLYPLFSIAQVPQDSFAAMFSSGLKAPYALSIPFRAMKEFVQTLRGKSEAHSILKNVAAVGVRDFTSAIVREDAEIAAGLKKERGIFGRAKEMLGNLAMAADNAVRQAVYTAAIDQGLSKSEAMEKAFEIFNVRRRGNSQALALAGQVIPFFNAYLAAQHVAYRTLTGVGTSPTERKEAFKVLAATTGSVMALSMLYAMMMGDDEDYIKKATPTRDRLLMIPGMGGFGIPLRADLFLLPKALAEHTYLLLTDNGYEDPAKFRSSMASLLANSFLSPTVVPQAVKPLIEVGINYDFFQDKPLVGVFQQQKDLDRQFEDSTSEFAKALAKVPVTYNFAKNQWEGLSSPIGIDHIVRGMFGSFGGLFLYSSNLAMSAMSDTPRPAMELRDALATIPNMSAFVSKTYEPGLRKDFYALKEVTDRVAATVADMKTRSPQELADYLSDEEHRTRYALSKPVTQIANKLTDIRKRVNMISQLPEDKMDEDQKQAAIKQLREQEMQLLKGINIKALRERAGM